MTRLSLLFLSLCTLAAAEPAADLEKRLADLDKATKSAQSAGDNAWMLVSAALVLMMTGPGLALFYGGLVRRKNVLSTMMHSFILMAVVTRAVGRGRLQPGVRRRDRRSSAACIICSCTAWAPRPMPITRATIPQQTFMIYQLMFAIITPGADLRRVRRAHEILRHAAVHRAVDADRLFPDGAHGVGQGRIAQRHSGRQDSVLSISPAARWCTSPPAFRRWCARCIWESARAIRTSRCGRTAWC